MNTDRPDTGVPLVSVIIPNYNHGHYLDQRIQSVLNQTFQDFELIILDDRSTDNSREIIERYRDHPRVTSIVYNETNGGSVFKQWKKGVEIARGKYIWMAESDDYCESSFLQYVVPGLEKNENCLVAYCQALSIDSHDNVLWQSSYGKLEDVVRGSDFIVHHLTVICGIFNASMAIFRREAFAKVDEEFLSFRFSGDWYFWIELCRKGDVFVCGRVLNYFRNHSGDVTTRAVKTGQNFTEAMRILSRSYDLGLVPYRFYWKAVKTQHRVYWGKRDIYTKEIRKTVNNAFYNRSTHIPSLLLRLDAFSKYTRMAIKGKKRK